MPNVKMTAFRTLVLLAAALLTLLGGTGCTTTTPTTSVKSPNGAVKIDIQSTEGKLTWSVSRQGKTVITPAALGLTIDDKVIGQGVTLGTPKTRTINEKYATNGNHREAVNHCNELIVPVEGAGVKYEVHARAFNDGAAVRLKVAVDDTAHKIAGEATEWVLPEVKTVWWGRYDQSNEAVCQMGTLDTVPSASNPAGPNPSNYNLSVPITMKDGNDLYVSLTEANNDCFPDMGLQRNGSTFKAHFPPSTGGWTQQGPFTTPWRVAIITDNLNDLVNSDMLTSLCPPPSPELAKADWIKPGKSLWHWWSVGAPRLADQRAWFDAAKRLGFEYYLIDDGWRNWRAEGKDQWQCLKEVIDYGKSQGIASLVWVNSNEMRQPAARRAYLEKVASLGAAGIKIDFIPSCTAEVTRWYEETLKDTADLKLLCNFHGAVKPTGRRRTWPHELTREGVRGLEYQMTRYRRVLPAEHDEIVLFTRFLAGPADYTPTTFDAREINGYTWGHMLAQSVVMTSPLLHFGGGYREFIDNPAEDFLRHLPTDWDQTIVLPGTEIGETVVFARRRGQDWYIGSLSGKEDRNVAVDLSFLGQGAWQAEIFADDFSNPAAFKIDKQTVTAKDKLTLQMRQRGGVSVRIRKSS